MHKVQHGEHPQGGETGCYSGGLGRREEPASTARVIGVARNTVGKLLVVFGYACALYEAKALHKLPCKRVQADEIWRFV